MNNLSKVGDIHFVRKITKAGLNKINATNNEGQKIGFAKYIPNKCELFDIEVNENFYRRGIGTQLFKESMNDLKLSGCEKVYWMATSSSVSFYLQQGAWFSSDDYPNLGLVRMSISL